MNEFGLVATVTLMLVNANMYIKGYHWVTLIGTVGAACGAVSFFNEIMG